MPHAPTPGYGPGQGPGLRGWGPGSRLVAGLEAGSRGPDCSPLCTFGPQVQIPSQRRADRRKQSRSCITAAPKRRWKGEPGCVPRLRAVAPNRCSHSAAHPRPRGGSSRSAAGSCAALRLWGAAGGSEGRARAKEAQGQRSRVRARSARSYRCRDPGFIQ